MVRLLILEKTLREEEVRAILYGNRQCHQLFGGGGGACSNTRTLMLVCVILESFI